MSFIFVSFLQVYDINLFGFFVLGILSFKQNFEVNYKDGYDFQSVFGWFFIVKFLENSFMYFFLEFCVFIYVGKLYQ